MKELSYVLRNGVGDPGGLDKVQGTIADGDVVVTPRISQESSSVMWITLSNLELVHKVIACWSFSFLFFNHCPPSFWTLPSFSHSFVREVVIIFFRLPCGQQPVLF